MKYKIGERIYEYSGEKSLEEDITEELDKESLNDLKSKCSYNEIVYNEHCDIKGTIDEEYIINDDGFLDELMQLETEDYGTSHPAKAEMGEPSHPYDQIHHGFLGKISHSQKFTDNSIDEKTTTIIAELIDFYANKIKTMKQEFEEQLEQGYEEAYQEIIKLQKENKELKSRKE